MLISSHLRRNVQTGLQIIFKGRELRWKGRRSFVSPSQCISRLQPVPSNTENRGLVGRDASLLVKLLGGADGYATSRFRKYALRLREQLNRVREFGIRYILGPATALGDGSNGIMTVGRISAGQRSRNAHRLLRLYFLAAALHRCRNPRTSRRLSAIELH